MAEGKVITLSDDIKRVLTLGDDAVKKWQAFVEKAMHRQDGDEYDHYRSARENLNDEAILMASIISQQQELLREAYGALELSQTWLANCVPVSEVRVEKPLPVISATLSKIKTALGDV